MLTQQYVENDLVDKTPVELVRVLYSKAIEKLSQAAVHTHQGEVRERNSCLARAMEIVAELQGALNLEAGGELAIELAKLYDYMQWKLIEAAGDSKAQAPLSAVAALLGNLLEGWRDCNPPAQPAQAPPRESPAPQAAEAEPAPLEWPEDQFAVANRMPGDDVRAVAMPARSKRSRESRVWTL